MGIRTWLVALAASAIGLALPAAADARAQFADACILAAEDVLSFEEASRSSEWICPATPEHAEAEHSWLRFEGESLPSGEFVLQGDAMPSDGLFIVAVGRDGDVAGQTWPQEDLSSAWTAGTRFSVPVPVVGSSTDALYVRIDGPLHWQEATSLVAVASEAALSQKIWMLPVFGAFSGMLAIVALYSAVMASALRSRFAFYHFAGTVLLLVYTVSSSSLIFLVLPGLSLWERSGISYASVALSVSLLAPFLINFLERWALSPACRRALWATCSLLVFASMAIPIAAATGWNMRPIYHLAYLPAILAASVSLMQARRRGSRAAMAFLLVWAIPFAIMVERILRSVDMSPFGYVADFAIYAAIAIEATGMTLAITWRVGNLRRERDEALIRSKKLADEAATDSLTGLPNRRDFNRRTWRSNDILGIIDLDYFKRINDDCGHDTGDMVLARIGQMLTDEVAEGRLLRAWRLGGEEFAVAIAGNAIEAGALVLNEMRDRIASETRALLPPGQRSLTASAGLALVGQNGMRQAYRAADSALYHAKAGGRDRLCFESGEREIATIFPRRKAA